MASTFVGREYEMAELERLYASDTFEMPVVYGRRRVGKTRLITEFIRGKRAIYVQARRTNARTNLRLLSQAVYTQLAGAPGESAEPARPAADVSFDGFDTAFDAVADLARTERLVLVIDEYPYLAQSHPDISSLLQEKIDHTLVDSKLMLILCGSSLSFMEEQVLGYESPIYGRRTAQFKLRPFDFFTTRQCWPGMAPEDAAVLYGATGGVPAYSEKVDPTRSVRDNLTSLFFTPSGYLHEEPGNLLLQECRDPSQYDAIIQAIAVGRSRLSEIASMAKIPESNTKAYLDKLITLGIVRREMPYGEDSNKKAVYALGDQMFRFWYRFVPQNLGLIQNGMGNLAFDRVALAISEYMGPVFEEICRQYIVRRARTGDTEVLPATVARWWGTDPRTRSQEEVDIVVDDGAGAPLLCECKWRNQPTDVGVLDTLVHRGELLRSTRRFYELFSKSGFTDACQAKARAMGNVRLTTFDEMCR